eukprot:gnl/TRDRNA2_/TRDRNA2_189378_c0_seq1.p1 gnl/TRDRNA2_/TRDRNA2_189378_c0~~gnl/TRDRNA2_/TRDRNA2_189378_c0_seq1.p1  ORF type:complete len:491 (+),score=91.35 gnl/TRDRNA2_/TRDRNA2_189378_c0_seq1:41-1474(+)
MPKKALCVGCNYPSKAFGLAGAVNDAFLVADCLQKSCGFEPENVMVLHDVYPGQKKSMQVDASQKPTRVNVLQRLQMLVRTARPGDVLFFSFSGYGLQVDDMNGYQDEGYHEAILPTDFVDGRDGDYAVIVTDDIHDILMGIPPNVAVTVLMDCDHATSVVDVAGTLEGNLVQGLKYTTYCGFSTHTTKVQQATHNRDVWQEERARTVKARPRFQPMMEIDNPKKGRLPTRPSMSRSSPVSFCFSAAGHGQTAMEMQMIRVVDGKDVPRQHGILTWCFVRALEEMKFDCTYMQLWGAIRAEMEKVKQRDLPRMDQEVLMTFSTPLSDPHSMKVLCPLSGQQSQRVPSLDGGAGAGYMPMPVKTGPPPPGFTGLGGPPTASAGAGRGYGSQPAVPQPTVSQDSWQTGGPTGKSFNGFSDHPPSRDNSASFARQMPPSATSGTGTANGGGATGSARSSPAPAPQPAPPPPPPPAAACPF